MKAQHLQYFESRIAGEQPREYANRVGKLLQDLEDRGIEWTEEPIFRGALLFSVGPEGREAYPFAYIEYPK